MVVYKKNINNSLLIQNHVILWAVNQGINTTKTGNIMKARQMTSNSGNPVANQFILKDTYKDGRIKALYFQSYDSVIVKIAKGKTYLDEYYWDYSRTTGKYRNDFLNENIADTRKKIESGEYLLTNLN
jgi:hypothetical protein